MVTMSHESKRPENIQYIPRNMHTVFALLCFVVVIHWLIFPYLSGLLHWHCGNLTIAPVPAKQPWWIWINTSCEFIMKDCITTTKQSTTKPCAYFLGYTVTTKNQSTMKPGIYYMGYTVTYENSIRYYIHISCFHVSCKRFNLCVQSKLCREAQVVAPGKFEWNFRYVILKRIFSDWRLRHLLWNCPYMNVNGLHWW